LVSRPGSPIPFDDPAHSSVYGGNRYGLVIRKQSRWCRSGASDDEPDIVSVLRCARPTVEHLPERPRPGAAPLDIIRATSARPQGKVGRDDNLSGIKRIWCFGSDPSGWLIGGGRTACCGGRGFFCWIESVLTEVADDLLGNSFVVSKTLRF
jgi:hypothetical protein